MNKYILIFLLLIAGATVAAAQKTFLLKGESAIYDVKVGFDECEEEESATVCRGKTTFFLLKKNSPQVFQQIEVQESYLSVSGKTQQKGDLIEVYAKEGSSVYFVDYNFDGIEDLGISNGDYRPYGGVSYDVYLFSKAQGKFVRDRLLSEIQTENVSVDFNKKRRIIETQTKSGCCWHGKTRYRFINNRWQKFYSLTEDGMDGQWVKITTERLVGGKWRLTTKRVSLKQYYKD